MSAIEILSNAMKTDWVQTQDFTFTYTQNPNFTNFTITDLLQFSGSIQDIFDMCTISVDVPQATASEIDTVLGGERRVNIRMQELFRFSAKFRDFQGLGLRNYFKGIWIATHSEYPDTINGTVRILDSKGNLVFQSTNVTVNSVSAVQFDNNSNQIAEFDVQFLSPTLSDFTINNFGKSNYGDVFTSGQGDALGDVDVATVSSSGAEAPTATTGRVDAGEVASGDFVYTSTALEAIGLGNVTPAEVRAHPEWYLDN